MDAEPTNTPPACGWRAPTHGPGASPRWIALVLALGGTIVAGFDCWQRLAGKPIIPVLILGHLVVGIWYLRALNITPSLSVAGWWVSIVWHALYLLVTLPLFPFALALGFRVSICFLLPHAWLAAALGFSIIGLRNEKRRMAL